MSDDSPITNSFTGLGPKTRDIPPSLNAICYFLVFLVLAFGCYLLTSSPRNPKQILWLRHDFFLPTHKDFSLHNNLNVPVGRRESIATLNANAYRRVKKFAYIVTHDLPCAIRDDDDTRKAAAVEDARDLWNAIITYIKKGHEGCTSPIISHKKRRT